MPDPLKTVSDHFPESAPDWARVVRRHLPRLPVSPARETEIVEELAQLLRDASEDAAIDPADNQQVGRWLSTEVPQWRELAGSIAEQEHSTLLGRSSSVSNSSNSSNSSSPSSPSSPSGHARARRITMVGLSNDFRYALRVLRRSPVMAGIVVLTLALGIGLNSAVFSLVNTMIFKPLPLKNAKQLVRVFTQVPDGFLSHEPIAYPDYADLREQSETLAGVAAYSMMFAALEADGRAVMGIGEMVTGNYFEILGVRPQVGRLLTDADDLQEDPQQVVVLSHPTWQKRFAGSPSVVGSEVILNGQPMTVVGVTPKGFGGLFRGIQPDLWMPLVTAVGAGATAMQNAGSFDAELTALEDRGRRWLWLVGRRAPGASFDQTLGEIETIGRRLQAAYPESNEERELTALPLRQVKVLPGIDTSIRTGSFVLMGVVALVLLIASINLANLLLSRAVSRRREMATRLSIGAARNRIVRQLLIESSILATIGAAAGLMVAAISNAALRRFELPFTVPIHVDVGLDFRVVLFTLGLATLTALLFGLAPALDALRTDLATVLRDESSSGGGTGWGRRFQGALVVAQVALSLLLLIFAGLSARSLLNAHSIDPGFGPEGVIAATLAPDVQGYSSEEVESFFSRLREQLESEPGVESVSLPSHLPLTMWINTWTVIPEGQEGLPQEEWPEVDTASVDPSYFETLRIPILKGRTFAEEEGRDGRLVMIVNQTLADRFWPGDEALGKRIRPTLDADPYEVVGVVADGKYRTLGEQPRPFAYLAITPDWAIRTAVVRFERPESASAAVVAGAIRKVDEHLAINNLAPLDEFISPALILPRAGAFLFGLFGLLGLLLATIGLYGVLAYMVSQRRHEIGIRVAVGATSRNIVRLVVRDGARLTLIGAALGVALSLVGSRALSSILYGIQPNDVGTFVAVVAFFMAVALVACYLPARRATRVDPIQALRYE